MCNTFKGFKIQTSLTLFFNDMIIHLNNLTQIHLVKIIQQIDLLQTGSNTD